MFSKAALALLSGFVTSCVASQAPNCPPCGSGQPQLSQAEAQQQLDLHNQFRHAVHGTADHDLEWNCELMCQAQVVGDTCTFQHSGSYGSAIQAGENLATGTDGELAAWLWFQEYVDYDVPQYKSGVGHYTAMVWKNTGWLGCGVCRTPSAGQRTIYVCQYANGPSNFGFQGTNYYEENAPIFQGTRQQYNTGGITEATVLQQLGRICNFAQWVPSFQSACNARDIYQASPSLLQISHESPKHFRKKLSNDAETSSLLQTSLVVTDDSSDCEAHMA